MSRSAKTVWATAPNRKDVEQFTVVGEHDEQVIGIDKRDRPVLIPKLAAYETRELAIVHQGCSRDGWVACLGRNDDVATVERCKFNPNSQKGRYCNSYHWQTLDGKNHSVQHYSHKVFFGLTKKEVLEKLADRLPGAINSAQSEAVSLLARLKKAEAGLKRLREIRSECRRAGFLPKTEAKR